MELFTFADTNAVVMPTLSKEARSYIMSKIKSKDTKPEWIVRRYLYSRGYRYRKNVKELPGTPDIVLRKYGIVIFVHGCFWHGHDTHKHIPKTNRSYWEHKIERNKARDEKAKSLLRALGWSVITIWECQLKPYVREQTLFEMEYYINKAYLDSLRRKGNRYGWGDDGLQAAVGLAAEDKMAYGAEEGKP